MQTRVKDITLDYVESGQGQPLLFIHGFPLNKAMWEPQIDGLSDCARLIAVDLRGHGASETTPAPYSMDLFASDIASFLDALQIQEKVVLCGLSMGGYVTMAFSRLYPERLKGLIFVATRAGPDSPEAQRGRESSANAVSSTGIKAVAEAMLPKLLAPQTYQEQPELVKKLQAIMMANSGDGAVGALLAMRDRPDSFPGLKTLRVPTQIVHGDKDQIFPKAEAQAIQSAVPGALLEIIPGSGHMLNLEAPAHFNQVVRAFLNNL